MASTPAAQALLDATSKFVSVLLTGEDTENVLNDARDRFVSQIHSGRYMIDPSKVGDAPIEKFKAPRPLSRAERVARLQWCTRLDEKPAEDEEPAEDKEPADENDLGEDEDEDDEESTEEEAGGVDQHAEAEQDKNEEMADNESESSAPQLERIVNRYVATINGEFILVQDIVGKERERMIRDLHGLSKKEHSDPLYAARPRFKWQKSGTAMMRQARRVIGGYMNVDEMGLGKTTQALDDIYGEKRCENDAFNLVLTEKSVLMSWAKEGEKSYSEAHRPRVMILDDSRISFAEVWNGDFDVVIASYAAIMYQHRKLRQFTRFMDLWQHSGLDAATLIANKEKLPTRRPTLSVLTALLEFLPCRIPTKVLDEAHRLKKWNGINRAAVQEVLTESVGLLSGTPCGNTWADLFTMSDLLPYEFVHGKQEWHKVFAPEGLAQRHKPPNEVEFCNIIRYFLSFTIGRTIDLLNLPGIIYEPDIEFQLSQEKSERTLWLIDRFQRCIHMGDDEKGELSEEDTKAAMGYCTKAEQESAFPTLTKYTPLQLRAMQDKPMDMKLVRRLFETDVAEELRKKEFDQIAHPEIAHVKTETTNVEEARAAGQDENPETAQVKNEGTENEGSKEFEIPSQLPKAIQDAYRVPQWADTPVDDLSVSAYTRALTRWLFDCGFQAVRAADPLKPKQTQPSVNPSAKRTIEDIMDQDYDPIEEEDDAEELHNNDEDAESEPEITANTSGIGAKNTKVSESVAQKARKKSKYLEFEGSVAKMTDEDLLTPRCKALVDLYNRIQRDYPGEKMIIWSRFYQALVLIREAFRRLKKADAPIYSGLLDTKERTRLITKWEDSQLTPSTTPILFQAKSGNTGLTINAASHCIFFEPWWNRQDMVQAERRGFRVGQTRKVHIWKLCATNSFADAIINAGGLRKLRTIDKIMASLRPTNGEEIKIPELVPQVGNIGWVNYDYYQKLDERAKQEEADEAVAESKKRRLEEVEADTNGTLGKKVKDAVDQDAEIENEVVMTDA